MRFVLPRETQRVSPPQQTKLSSQTRRYTLRRRRRRAADSTPLRHVTAASIRPTVEILLACGCPDTTNHNEVQIDAPSLPPLPAQQLDQGPLLPGAPRAWSLRSRQASATLSAARAAPAPSPTRRGRPRPMSRSRVPAGEAPRKLETPQRECRGFSPAIGRGLRAGMSRPGLSHPVAAAGVAGVAVVVAAVGAGELSR